MIKNIFIPLATIVCCVVAVSGSMGIGFGFGEEEEEEEAIEAIPLNQIPYADQLPDWNNLKEQLFDETSEYRFSPDDMLDKLRQMKELSDNLQFTGDNELSVVEGVELLIELGTLNDDDCSDEVFERFGFVLVLAQSGPIYDYVDHFGRKQYKVCEPKFEQQLDTAIGELSLEQQELFQAFINGRTRFNAASMSNGVLALLEKKGVKLNSKMSFGEISYLLEESIEPVCHSVQAKLRDFVSSHNFRTSFWRYRFEDDLVGDKTSEWLIKYELCNKFLENQIAVIDEIQHILMK